MKGVDKIWEFCANSKTEEFHLDFSDSNSHLNKKKKKS